MKPLHLAAFLCLPLAAFAQQLVPQHQPEDLIGPCVNVFQREPLVAYEVTGGTLSGPVDLHLIVFSDGSARLGSSLGDGTGSSQLVQLDPVTTTTLLQQLVALGAMTHCDLPDFLSDVPLSTLTVLRGQARQRGNTFSWNGGDEATGAMQALLSDFIDEHFAPPPGGSRQ